MIGEQHLPPSLDSSPQLSANENFITYLLDAQPMNPALDASNMAKFSKLTFFLGLYLLFLLVGVVSTSESFYAFVDPSGDMASFMTGLLNPTRL